MNSLPDLIAYDRAIKVGHSYYREMILIRGRGNRKIDGPRSLMIGYHNVYKTFCK